MLPEARVSSFKPASITVHRTEASDPARTAGFSAGWAAGARAAADAATTERTRLQAEHDAREGSRDEAVSHALGALGSAMDQWNHKANPVLDEARRTLYAAALDLAAAILQREIVPGSSSARTLLDRALCLPSEATPSVMRLHPDDLLHVNLLIESGQAVVPAGLLLVGDSRLSHGDAITEHEDGALDARIGTALARAREVLLGDAA